MYTRGWALQPDGAANAKALRRVDLACWETPRRSVCLGWSEQEEQWKEWQVEEVVNCQILEVKVRYVAFTLTWEPFEDF